MTDRSDTRRRALGNVETPCVPLLDRPLIYVAGYFSANPMHGTRNAFNHARALEDAGFTAFVPHVSILADIIYPQTSDYWYAYDLALLARCDAMYVCPDEETLRSTGVHNEILFCEERGIPVIYTLPTAEAWLRVWEQKRNLGERSVGCAKCYV